MKKEIRLLIILLAVILTFMTPTKATSSDLKESYQPGETIIIELSGEILQPISNRNVRFLRGHVEVPFIYDLKKLQDKYYLYAQSPIKTNNYTLKIEDISANINGFPTITDYSKNFSIQGETIPYSVDPGFANFEESFEFKIFSYKDENQVITIDYPEEKEITISLGENTIQINKNPEDQGLKKINIGIYSVPILILPSQGNQDSEPLQNLIIFPSTIESIIFIGEKPSYSIRVFNPSSNEISNAFFELDTSIFKISPELFPIISANSSAEFNLTILTSNIPITENITLKSSITNSQLDEIYISIMYTENENKTTTSFNGENFQSQGYYCKELEGEFCTVNEECSIDLVNSLDGQCCTGKCIEKTETSFTWIAWVFGLLIIVVIVWVYLKYKKSRSLKPNPLLSKIPKI